MPTERFPATRHPPATAARIGIFHLRHASAPLAQVLARGLPGTVIPPPQVLGAGDVRELLAQQFSRYTQWVWIMTTGIAVRYAAPWLQNKRTDPGIVVLDEASRFAVSLVGGHEGGANPLAYAVAGLTGATPVITTASEAVRPLVVGVGCRQGISAQAVSGAVSRALRKSGYHLEDVREVATIDRKGKEPGLLAWCHKQNLPLRIIRTEQIQDRPWYRTTSDWVQKTVGVPSVAEPCALIAAPSGKLVLERFAWGGVTVALCCDATTRGGTILLPATGSTG